MKVVSIGNIADAFRFDDLPATGIVIEATPDELERLANLTYKDVTIFATPRRNCDRFATVDEARKTHEAICEKYGKCHNGCPLNNEEHYSAFDCFEAWLFAPATEGGNNGNE